MKKLIVVGSLLWMSASSVLALEVDREVMPRIQLGGRIMASVDALDSDSDPAAESDLSLADSSLLLRFDKRMYNESVAGATVGITEDEDVAVFHQLNGFYWNRDFSVSIGRGRLHNTLLELPLMRDDDLLDYTHMGNASSSTEFDQIFGEQLAFDLFIDQKIQRFSMWAGIRRKGADPAFVITQDGFNSAGFGYVYEQPEALRFVKRLRHAGILLDAQEVKLTSGRDWLYALIGGGEANLNIDPRHSWSLAGQAIMNQGISGITAANVLHGASNAVASRAASESTSLVVSLRYTGRPKLLTRYQAGLTLAYKDYPDISDGRQWSVVSSAFHRLGQGVDLLAQLSYTDYGEGLGGGNDTVVQVGMAFSFDAMFNDTIGQRDSILNLEHGYIQ